MVTQQIVGARHLETGAADTIFGSKEYGSNWPGRRVRDVANEIALLDANNTALVTLLMKLRKQSCQDPRFEWQEDIFPIQTSKCTEVMSSTEAEVTITTGEGVYFREGDILYHPEDHEVCYVTKVAASALTLVRGLGDTDGGTWASGDDIFIIGNAQEMGDTARQSITTIVAQPYNHAQLFKEPFEVDNTANATKLHGGPDLTYLRRKHGELHKKDIERAFWWGARDLVSTVEGVATGGTYPAVSAAHTTRGVWQWLLEEGAGSHTNSSELTEDDFNGYLQTDFRYGNNVKFMFCSPLALTVISGWGRDKLQTVPRDTTFGINITRYISPHGELNLINTKLFGDIDGGANAAYNPAEASIILDLEQLKYRYLRDTKLELGIQENDRDGVEDQYLTECGLEFRLPKHAAGIWEWSQ